MVQDQQLLGREQPQPHLQLLHIQATDDMPTDGSARLAVVVDISRLVQSLGRAFIDPTFKQAAEALLPAGLVRGGAPLGSATRGNRRRLRFKGAAHSTQAIELSFNLRK